MRLDLVASHQVGPDQEVPALESLRIVWRSGRLTVRGTRPKPSGECRDVRQLVLGQGGQQSRRGFDAVPAVADSCAR